MSVFLWIMVGLALVTSAVFLVFLIGLVVLVFFEGERWQQRRRRQTLAKVADLQSRLDNLDAQMEAFRRMKESLPHDLVQERAALALKLRQLTKSLARARS